MGQNHEEQMRRTVAMLICLDLVNVAVRSLGTVNTADQSKIGPIVFDEVVRAAEAKKN